MMNEERTHLEVLVEDLHTQMKGLADACLGLAEGQRRAHEDHLALVARIDRMEARFEVRFDILERRVDKLEERFDKLEAKVDKLEQRFDKLEAFAADAKPQLHQITKSLGLNPPLVRARAARPAAASKHHRKRATKRS
jgi:predicted nuclease with TOPRIM domain